MASYSLLEYCTAAFWYCGVHGSAACTRERPTANRACVTKFSQRSTISQPAVLITTTFGTK